MVRPPGYTLDSALGPDEWPVSADFALAGAAAGGRSAAALAALAVPTRLGGDRGDLGPALAVERLADRGGGGAGITRSAGASLRARRSRPWGSPSWWWSPAAITRYAPVQAGFIFER